MSWEIFIQDLPEVARLSDVPPDFRPGPIGLRSGLVEQIKDVVPVAEEQDNWIFVNTSDIDLSIQFHMEDATRVRYLLIHVHGGDASRACVAKIIERLGLRAVDTDTGELFDAARLLVR